MSVAEFSTCFMLISAKYLNYLITCRSSIFPKIKYSSLYRSNNTMYLTCFKGSFQVSWAELDISSSTFSTEEPLRIGKVVQIFRSRVSFMSPVQSTKLITQGSDGQTSGLSLYFIFIPEGRGVWSVCAGQSPTPVVGMYKNKQTLHITHVVLL